MGKTLPQFPAYGDDGDLAGARRGRRAFRLCVIAVILLTGFMYISERFLRYGQVESLYLNAITHERDSARVFLQAAIKIDNETSETPTAKYLQALAVRQEDDIIIETYARAWELDPSNALFGLRYGARLFILGRPGEALEKFREAKNLPPPNALDRYLEAAALAHAGKDRPAIREAMVLVSRTNNAAPGIIFPKPIWFSGYPDTGIQYATLTREIIDESCALLYHLSDQVVREASNRSGESQVRDARTWLEQIQRMGERMLQDSDPRGTLQSLAGITLQLQAIAALEKLATQEERTSDPALMERRVKLNEALEVLNEFEATREERIAAYEEEIWRPLELSAYGIGLIFTIYLLTLSLHKIFRLRKSSWALPHSPFGKWVLGIGVTSIVLLLQLLTALQAIPGPQSEYAAALASIWWTAIGVLIAFGLIYPAVRLSSPEEVSRRSGRLEEMSDTIRVARQAYRRVYAALVVRYYGILTGLSCCALCVWVIGYRVMHELYPWQINVLTDGLLQEELKIVDRVLSILS